MHAYADSCVQQSKFANLFVFPIDFSRAPRYHIFTCYPDGGCDMKGEAFLFPNRHNYYEFCRIVGWEPECDETGTVYAVPYRESWTYTAETLGAKVVPCEFVHGARAEKRWKVPFIAWPCLEFAIVCSIRKEKPNTSHGRGISH